MKKKIAADLTSLAHRVLQIKDKNDVEELQGIAKELYEKLTILVFTEKHFSQVKPTAGRQEIEDTLNLAFDEVNNDVQTIVDEVEGVRDQAFKQDMNSYSTNSLTDLFVEESDTREEIELPGMSTIQKMVTEMPDEAPDVPQPAANIYYDVEKDKNKELDKERQSYTTNSLTHLVVPEDGSQEEIDLPGMTTIQKMVFEMPDEELAIPPENEVAASSPRKENLEQLTADFQTMPVFERKSESQPSDRPKSLNSKLNSGFKIGMNDRLGFVKHLFNGNNQDFNRVISQLNTISTSSEAHTFIQTMVKPDYNNWEGKENYENRFLELIERNY